MMSQKRVAVLSAFMFQSQTRDIKIPGRYDSADTAGTVASFGLAPQLGLGLGRWGYVFGSSSSTALPVGQSHSDRSDGNLAQCLGGWARC